MKDGGWLSNFSHVTDTTFITSNLSPTWDNGRPTVKRRFVIPFKKKNRIMIDLFWAVGLWVGKAYFACQLTLDHNLSPELHRWHCEWVNSICNLLSGLWKNRLIINNKINLYRHEMIGVTLLSISIKYVN